MNGFIVDFSKAHNTAEKILEYMKLCEEEKRVIGNDAKSKARHYDWDNQVEKIRDVYKSIR